MSTNKLINAVIALVEDRPQVAREMLRSPEMTVPISEVQNRLFIAVRKREDTARLNALKDVLRSSLRIDPGKPKGKVDWSDEQREAFLLGVGAVENLVDNLIDALGTESQILSSIDPPVLVHGDYT